MEGRKERRKDGRTEGWDAEYYVPPLFFEKAGDKKHTYVVVLIVSAICFTAGEEYYNIAHMTNTPHAVDWAIDQGANALELDLHFAKSGNMVRLARFKHGGGCDCTCICPWPFWSSCSDPAFVCTALRHDSSSPCDAGAPVQELLSHVAGKSEIALVYIDSKVDTNWNSNLQQQAGRKVVLAVTNWLFEQGYHGNVIIGAFKDQRRPYLESAVHEASISQHRRKIFFSLELAASPIFGAYNTFPESYDIMRYLNTNNIIFGTGASSCLGRDHSLTTLELARDNKNSGRISMAYTWTDDHLNTIRRDLRYVQGIITNYPSRVRDELRRAGKQLATQSSTIPAATVN